MTTVIEINSLRLRAAHGVFDQERIIGNDFEVTARLRYRFPEDDNIDKALNYAEAIAIIKDVMAVPVNLIETLTFSIKTALTAKFPLIEGGMIKVSKLRPPVKGIDLENVSAVLEW